MIDSIINIKPVGQLDTIDLEVDSPDHNFYCNDICVSNSHAISYSALTAMSLYLKFKYPLDFFLESLKLAKDKQDISTEINLIQSELKYFNINLLPPDLVKSDLDFKKEGNNLRFGLSAIKGIADKSLERLKEFLSAEKVTKFDVFNAAQNSKLNIGILSALIQAGTLSSIEEDRPRLVFESQLYNQLTPREKLWCMEHGAKYGYSLFNILLAADEIIDKTGKRVFKETRLDTLKKKAEPYRNIYKINSKAPELASYVFETRLLGFSYSQKLSQLMNKYSSSTVMSLFKSKFEDDDSKFSVTGDIIDIQERTSKKGKGYIKIDISDESGQSELLLFEPNLTKLKEQGKIPKTGDIVIADIQKWNGTCTVKDLKVCTDKVYLKLSELKIED